MIGFAAETSDVLVNATQKRLRKGCDWLLANSVAAGHGFDQDENQVTLIREGETVAWERQTKTQIARRLVEEIIAALGKK